MRLLPRIAGAAYHAWSRGAARRMRRAIADPVAAQAAARERILGRGGSSAPRAGLVDLAARGLDPVLERNPVTTWEDVRPLAERVAAGERDALTREPARFLEPSGGSTGGDKLVPYTGALLAEFGAATTAWVHDLLHAHPSLRRGRAYWAVSPPGRQARETAGGVPVGVPHDSDYFPPVARRLIDATLGLPRALSGVVDHDAHRYVTLRALLAMDDLSLVSVWSPSFLTLLAEVLDEQWPRLVRDLEHGGIDAAIAMDDATRAALAYALPSRVRRARELRTAFGGSAPRDLGEVWPRLELVSCWTAAQAALALPAMVERVPGVRVQGKGLLATEGVTSIPLAGLDAPVAAVGSHVLEFLPVDPQEGSATALLVRDPTAAGAARAAHELDAGSRYEVVLTTGGGLVRYRTFDVVACVGHAPGTPTPLLDFVGRADAGSDLAGEKLVPDVVRRAIDGALADVGAAPDTWALVAPDVAGRSPRYVLAVDGDRIAPGLAAALGDSLERRLRAAHHYALCRDLGQLGPAGVERLDHPLRSWTRACADLGQRTGVIKPTVLDPRIALLPRLRAHGGATERAEVSNDQQR